MKVFTIHHGRLGSRVAEHEQQDLYATREDAEKALYALKRAELEKIENKRSELRKELDALSASGNSNLRTAAAIAGEVSDIDFGLPVKNDG